MRLYPTVPFIIRWCNKDTILPRGGGPDEQSPLLVPRGTSVYLAFYPMHRRKDIFGEDADEFKPERWATLRPGWAFLPFSGGPRVCIGRKDFLHPCPQIISLIFTRAICARRSHLHDVEIVTDLRKNRSHRRQALGGESRDNYEFSFRL